MGNYTLSHTYDHFLATSHHYLVLFKNYIYLNLKLELHGKAQCIACPA